MISITDGLVFAREWLRANTGDAAREERDAVLAMIAQAIQEIVARNQKEDACPIES